jgi:glycosyltransferase involved in cell wall biosynthesis
MLDEMTYTILKEIPQPPSDKTDWPWTEESPQLSDIVPDGSSWPKISIVTPSLNQGQFIEETIRSVLLQGYPNLEYIIIDGESRDGSIDIIKKYEKWLNYWISEPDTGQSNAINKGLSKATGDIVAWLNSDDFYLPGTLEIIAEQAVLYPHAGAWAGGGRQIDSETGKQLWERLPPPLSHKDILNWREYYLPQPSCFLNRKVLGEKLYLNEAYHMQMDFDLWLRISREFEIVPINQVLSVNYRHIRSKTGRVDLQYRALAEKWMICLEHGGLEYTANEIEKTLRGDIELIEKLRRISQKKMIHPFVPLLKRILKKYI